MKRMVKKFLSIVTILSIVILAGCSSQTKTTSESTDSQTEKKEVKIGIVFTTAGLGGESFNDLAFAGVKKAAEDFGITYDYVEPKAVSDQEITQDEMAASGNYDLIIAIGFEQVDALKTVAANYPEQKFALIDATVDLPNVTSYVSKEHEATFLVGALSALTKNSETVSRLSKDKILGFIGGVESPLINRFAAGFMAGARYIDPEYNVLVDYVGGFNDPSTAKVIAETMYSQKADLIFHAAGASGMGLFQAAQEKNFTAIGVNSNQNIIAPDFIMASMLKLANQAAYDVIESVVKDTYKAGTHTLGIKENGVGYTVDKSNIKISEDIIKQVDELKEKVASGEIEVPTEIKEVENFINSKK